MRGMDMTMMDTDSEWSFPKEEEAASEEGVEEEVGEVPQPGEVSTGVW